MDNPEVIPHMFACIIAPTLRNAPALGTFCTPLDTKTKESRIEA